LVLAQISLQRVQALVSDGRSVPIRGQPNLKQVHGISDIDYRKARALVYALRGAMDRTGAVKTSYDGRTVEKVSPSSRGYKFQVWGVYYIWEQAVLLVRQGKDRDAAFTRLLEGGEPTMVDILLAQETLLGILGALRPVGRN
jgi:hypothetical protein